MTSRADVEARIVGIAQRPSGRLLLLGDAGIGKSTLLERATTAMRVRGYTVLRANPSFAERTIAYSTLWDVLSAVDWESSAQLREEYRLFLRVALGASQPQSALPPLAVSVAVEELLVNLALESPVVIVIDDAQWADPESIVVLKRAWRRSRHRPVFLVTTRRAAPLDDDPAFDYDQADTLTLPGLSPRELDEVARKSWPTTLTAAQLDSLHAHTAGNPMWALALIARGTVADLGVLPVGSVAAPATLTESVEARMRRLSVAAADVVSVVALIGRSTPEQLVAVLELDALPHAAIAEAEGAGFLTFSGDSLRVSHPLHASAAVARLLPARRRALHGAIAGSEGGLEARAGHLQQSERSGPNADLAHALDLAADAAGRRGAPIQAAHFAAQAVARSEPGSPAGRHRLLAQAHQLVSAGDYAAAADVLERIDPARLDCSRFDVYVSLASTAITATRGNAASREHLGAVALALPAPAERCAAVLAAFAEDDALPIAEHMRIARNALELLDADETPNAVRRATGVLIRAEIDLGLGLNAGLLDECAQREAERSVGALNETGLAQRGFFAKDLDDVSGSRTALAALLERAFTTGEVGVARIFSVHAAATELLAGDLGAARTHLDRSGYRPHDPGLPPAALAAMGLLMIADADWSGLSNLVAAQSGARAASARARELYAHGLLGLAAAAREDWPTAAVELRRAATIADERGLVELGRRFRVDLPLVEALFHTGAADEARMRLKRVRELLTAAHRPISRIALHRANSLDLAESGDIDGAIDEASGSADLARVAGRATDEGLALVYRARLSKRLRRSRAARLDLERARELAVGNPALAASIDATESTLRRVRSAATLTPAEERVLEHVRAGATNREISARLFVSVRTVESHVSSIVRKTGAASRLKLIVRR